LRRLRFKCGFDFRKKDIGKGKWCDDGDDV